jgi:hypothetical protein
MSTQPLNAQQKRYVYTLPQERIKVQANALAMGCLAALRDYPKALVDRGEIETQARAGCVTLKNSFAGQPLTNDFPAFCELFIEPYIRCYQENAQSYELSHEFYLKNKRKFDEIGVAAYSLLVEDYTAQLEGQKP